MNLSSEQLGLLLHRSTREPRRNLKRYLKDHGGKGSANELDEILSVANADPDAITHSKRLERQRQISARTIEIGVDGRVAEMLADVRVRMEERGITQSEVAQACNWSPPLVSDYLSGKKEPGIKNLAKLATAVGCVWRLHPDHTASENKPQT